MAKNTRGKTASKAHRKSKTLTKTAKTKGANKKAAGAKKRRTGAGKLAKKSKPAAPAPTKAAPPPSMGLVGKVEGAFGAVLDVLTDAERLHRKLEPEVSREPE